MSQAQNPVCEGPKTGEINARLSSINKGLNWIWGRLDTVERMVFTPRPIIDEIVKVPADKPPTISQKLEEIECSIGAFNLRMEILIKAMASQLDEETRLV